MVLYVKQQRVEVRSPLRRTEQEIKEFVQANYDWICRSLQAEVKRNRQAPVIAHGGRMYYQAREFSVVFQESSQQSGADYC